MRIPSATAAAAARTDHMTDTTAAGADQFRVATFNASLALLKP